MPGLVRPVCLPGGWQMGKGGVPDRWLDYSNIGHVVKGTRFVAFKVPLKPNILAKVIPEDLMYSMKKKNLHT